MKMVAGSGTAEYVASVGLLMSRFASQTLRRSSRYFRWRWRFCARTAQNRPVSFIEYRWV